MHHATVRTLLFTNAQAFIYTNDVVRNKLIEIIYVLKQFSYRQQNGWTKDKSALASHIHIKDLLS